MSIRNLDAIFRPRSIALIGASNRPNTVGSVIANNLLAGGFDGPIMPVNPKHQSVGGVLCYANIASLPLVPDLAVVCTPARTVPGLIAELGALGTKGVIVITAGFRELGSAEGRALEEAMLAAAQPHLLRIVGPNCLGVVSTPFGLNATFAPDRATKGGVAFVAQSGAMMTTVLDWASSRDIGFSHLVSLGDMADVDFGDMLDYLAVDAATTVILLYIEGVTSARKFMSAARAAARLKPVIAIKAGRHESAAKAATSHTGALAGIDAVYDAAFRRAGIVRVMDLEELFSAVETLSAPTSFSDEALTILTNGGGAGVLATDALADFGGKLADLSHETVAKLSAVLPPTWSHANPVDIIGDAPGKRYADALKIILDAPETNAVLVLNCPTAIASGIDAAKAVVETTTGRTGRVLTSWLGARSAAQARCLFSAARIPSFDTPTQAIRGFMHVVRYRQGQNVILEVPSSQSVEFTPETKKAKDIIDTALASGTGWLGDDAVRALLQGYGIPTVRTRMASDAEGAALAAREFAGPVVLKIRSPDITHKTEVGGVALDLANADVVREAAKAMLTRVGAAAPQARITGFVVQEMIRRPGAFELIAGMAVDSQFGPFLLFGQGGTAVEVIADKGLALPPLNLSLARELISQTRIFRQLRGYRNRPPVALDAIAMTLVRLSQLVCDFDEILELDINPLLADRLGVLALDARIRVGHPASGTRGGRLAIKPYPRELERRECLPATGEMILRPIRPEDSAGLMELARKLTPEDLRLRFFAPIRQMQPRQLMRLTQIDYDREMAFVLMPAGSVTNEILGVVRLVSDPDIRRAEFAIVVRSDLHRRKIGQLLMTRLIEYARGRGLEEIVGDVLPENSPMLALCRKLGFKSEASPGAIRVTLKL